MNDLSVHPEHRLNQAGAVSFPSAAVSAECTANGNLMQTTDAAPFHHREILHEALQHALEGLIRKGNCVGVHYFSPLKHRVVELLKAPADSGIWLAKIDVLHPKTGAWVRKKEASTFFPLAWTKEELMEKVTAAYAQREAVTTYKDIGRTNCGVAIVYIHRQGKVLCCYPLLD